MNRNRRNTGFSLIECDRGDCDFEHRAGGVGAMASTTALGSSKESESQTAAAMYAQGVVKRCAREGGIADGRDEGDCGAELPLYRWTESGTGAGVDGLHEVDVTIQSARTGAGDL